MDSNVRSIWEPVTQSVVLASKSSTIWEFLEMFKMLYYFLRNLKYLVYSETNSPTS